MLAHKLNPPVIAFLLVVLGGWGYALLTGDWLSVAFVLVIAILAGDLVDALLRKQNPEDNIKGRGKNLK